LKLNTLNERFCSQVDITKELGDRLILLIQKFRMRPSISSSYDYHRLLPPKSVSQWFTSHKKFAISHIFFSIKRKMVEDEEDNFQTKGADPYTIAICFFASDYVANKCLKDLKNDYANIKLIISK
jgi:hypothetical protein